MADETARLNPSVKEISYGKKTLFTLTVYPLSVGDQFKVTDMITEVVQKLVSIRNVDKISDLAFMTAIIGAIQKNIHKVLCLVSEITEDESTKVIDLLTNEQLMDLAEIIWESSYEPALKKGMNLSERVKKVFPSERSSQDS